MEEVGSRTQAHFPLHERSKGGRAVQRWDLPTFWLEQAIFCGQTPETKGDLSVYVV